MPSRFRLTLLARRTSFGRTGTTATASELVFDASAVVRALIDRETEAVSWLARVARDEARATCPALLFVEVTNALLVYQRAKRLTSEEARHVLEVVETLPFETRSMKALAFPAWIVADTRGLSAYDACYVALAETMGATLITADRRLAAATKDAVLIKG